MISVNGVEVTTIIDYNEEMKKYLPDSAVKLTVKREGKAIDFKVVFGEKDE